MSSYTPPPLTIKDDETDIPTYQDDNDIPEGPPVLVRQNGYIKSNTNSTSQLNTPTTIKISSPAVIRGPNGHDEEHYISDEDINELADLVEKMQLDSKH
jgi:hypothetical protein